jgi:signal transduction histidine kinase
MLPLVVVPLVVCGVLIYLLLNWWALEGSRNFLDERQMELRQFVERPTQPALAQVLTALAANPQGEETRRLYLQFGNYIQAYFRSLQAANGTHLALRIFDVTDREMFRAPLPLPPNVYPLNKLAPVLARSRNLRPGQPPYQTDLAERMCSAYPIVGRPASESPGSGGEPAPGVFLGTAMLEYEYPLAAFRREGRLVTVTSTGITLVLVSLAAFLVMRAVRSLVDPVEALARASEAVAGGDLSARAPVVSDDEVGRLARTFNEMTERLAVTIQALEELNQQLEEKVEARTAELAQAEALKTELLANVSHELRTPLNSVLNLSKVLLAGMPGPLNQEQQTQLRIIERNATRLRDLIESILDLTAVRTGSVHLEPRPVDLLQLLREVATACQTMTANKNLQFQLELTEHLPPVLCDPDRTKQVVLHLVSNAVKFTHQGSVRVGCEHDPLGLGHFVRCYIKDTGIGIAKEQQERIFGEFVQADGSLTRAYGGAGVGLSLVRRLVTAMGGEVQVSSETGAGSTFSFTLPTVSAPSVPGAPATTSAEPAPGGAVQSPTTPTPGDTATFGRTEGGEAPANPAPSSGEEAPAESEEPYGQDHPAG